MINRWNLLKDVKRVAPNDLEARADVARDCIWFTGHFPGEPILPGIALVNTVYEVIAWDAHDRGESVQISSLKRIRFTGPVRPGERFVLNLTREDAGQERLFHFKIMVEENIVCSGLVTAANIIKDKKS